MLCPLNRVLITDGKLLYNCCEFKELRGNEIKTEHPEIAVVGVIGEQKEVEIPTRFCGKKIKLIHSLNVYRKGEKFPEITGDFAFITSTVRQDIGFYYPCERLIPEPEHLINTHRTTAERVTFDGIAFDKSTFCGNRRLKSITFGTGKIQPESFMNCENLEKVELNEKVRVIGKKAFSGCKNLEYIILPKNVREIASDAFSLTPIRFIAIPPSVEAIMPYTFEKCKKLEMIFIPPSVISISKSAFYDANPNMIIAGKSGSFAEMYANKHKIKFLSYDNLSIEDVNSAFGIYKSAEK